MRNAIVRYKEQPKGNSWARWLVGRTMHRNQNNLIAIIGKTGSGKTWSGMSVAEIMSKLDGVPFTIEHVVFSLSELMELINSGKLKKGSKIVFDEPQVSISAREFQSEANKVFNYLLTTFRHRNLTLFFCCPFESLLDKNTRKLFHARFETMSIDKQNQTCRLKPRYLDFSDFKPEPYRKQLIIFFKDKYGVNKTKKLFYWDIPKPSQELINQYEAKKLDFTTRLNANITARLKQYDNVGKSMTSKQPSYPGPRKPLTEKQERAMRTIANIKESNRYQTASKILGLSVSSIAESVKLAEKKGYSLNEFKENNENTGQSQ